MNSKERVHAALEGKPVDRSPVNSVYLGLYHIDHFEELTGRPGWEHWKYPYAGPDEYLETFKSIYKKAPFELLQPDYSPPSREERENTEFVEKDGKCFRHDIRAGEWTELSRPRSGDHALSYGVEETRYVFDKKDADERILTEKAEERIAQGANDYIEAVVNDMGKEHFILSGGVTGTVFSSCLHTGMMNFFTMLIDEPDLVDYLCKRVLDQNIEIIRRLAAAGGDGIFIDESVASNDMISAEQYERFSLPYITEMVKEIHCHGHKAIIYHWGGIADRLEMLAGIGADGLLMEASMKGYVNDINRTVETIGDRVTMFSNIDPVSVLQDGTDAELEKEIKRQAAAGEKGRGFILSPASPITPGTDINRVKKFISLCKEAVINGQS